MPKIAPNRRYKIKNWNQYNRSLIQRGSITFWIDEGAISKWRSQLKQQQGGRPQVHSDNAILVLLMVREVFRLPLRALEGFIRSMFSLMSLSLPVPSYTQICRRAKTLHRDLQRLSSHKATAIIFDSSGLKVYGDGEWKTRTHGTSKRRTWRKFHIGVDPDTQEVISFELTDNSKGDAPVAEQMLYTVQSPIKHVYGDGVYDSASLRQEIYNRGGKSVIPPPKNATYKQVEDSWARERDIMLAQIEALGGDDHARSLWKKLVGYHKRSLGETAFFRLKTMFGEKLKSRLLESQKSEVYAKSLALNKMTRLGLPTGFWM